MSVFFFLVWLVLRLIVRYDLSLEKKKLWTRVNLILYIPFGEIGNKSDSDITICSHGRELITITVCCAYRPSHENTEHKQNASQKKILFCLLQTATSEICSWKNGKRVAKRQFGVSEKLVRDWQKSEVTLTAMKKPTKLIAGWRQNGQSWRNDAHSMQVHII